MKTNGRSKLSTQQRFDRDTKAVELRLAGVDYDTIAAKLGYGSRSHAFEAVNKLLEQRAREPVESLRTLELERLDKLMLAHWQAAIKGDEKKTQLLLRLMERRARLTGIDTPVAMPEVAVPDRIEIEHTFNPLPTRASDENTD